MLFGQTFQSDWAESELTSESATHIIYASLFPMTLDLGCTNKGY